jgi:hypothetical protein
LSFSYWIDNHGFITEGKLAAIFIKPSLGVSNWPVIYFINYTPTSFLAPTSPRHHPHTLNGGANAQSATTQALTKSTNVDRL